MLSSSPLTGPQIANRLRASGYWEEKSANFTAENNGEYIVTASATATDPSPTQGKGFSVLVRNGTATIGGTAYTAGVIVYRYYHSGAWTNYVVPSLGIANTWTAQQTIDLGSGTLPAITTTAAWLRLANSDSVNTAIMSDAWGAPAFFLEGRRAGGTRATPAATGSGENIFFLRAYGYNGTAYSTNRSASYAIKANSLWSGANQETAHVWEGTPSGSTTVATWMTLSGASLAVTRPISTSDTTDSTSTTTGSLIASGGIGFGVTKSLFGGGIKSTSPTLGIGYATGAGGTVTQGTSRTTGVTLDKVSGAITLFSAAGSAAYQSFTVTNSTVAATDTIIVNQKSGTDKNIILVTAVAAGSFQITFATTGGTTVEQPVFNFSVIKAVSA